MKKLLVLALVGAMTLSTMAGCSQQTAESIGTSETGTVMGDIAINIEGVVSEIDGNRITLDSGKVVIINDDTAFETLNVGETVEIDDEIKVGNYIQGFTSGDAEANEVTADVINTNEKMEISSKIAINIEGIVTEVDGNKITLDTGKEVIINNDTEFVTENVGNFIEVDRNIEVGNFIQGFTFGDAEANTVTADAISSNAVLEAPMGSAIVNIEGVITEVSEDGKSFLLDTGKWVTVNNETEMGITGPAAAPKDEQYFEDTFRVGNSIAGFTEDENAAELVAYAIYTNWNWEEPMK
ncbi:hypothetical protein JJQ72_14865 [Paenibacillus sp. F411]|uniref:DUF5666 domain-containing protein n=1 Tax=Paenibacillus sp. F411 TaxID=2820239 RepID=UPI001AAEAD04|nr:DUF5666 domain-containing protein [Paenibacillus sp. F411]MBO2945258.1 hypothetical protein [Paenibacillus sp. F411]